MQRPAPVRDSRDPRRTGLLLPSWPIIIVSAIALDVSSLSFAGFFFDVPGVLRRLLVAAPRLTEGASSPSPSHSSPSSWAGLSEKSSW
jgi:hypothetical protein